jgi:hypothetical protein
MEVAGPTETYINLYQTTRRHMLRDGALHNYRWENLKPYRMFIFWEDLSFLS